MTPEPEQPALGAPRDAEARRTCEGILQRDLGISEQDAYLAIQRQSRQRRKPTREIAEAILMADDLRRNRGSSDRSDPESSDL